jgi:hypothetical protein
MKKVNGVIYLRTKVVIIRGHCVSTVIFTLNCDFASTFSHFAFLPLLFTNEGAIYPYF